MKRTVVRLLALLAIGVCGLLLAPGAWALAPPAPAVTTPPTSEFSVVESAQPISFAGTVAGPAAAFDRVQVSNFTANPGDPPIICEDASVLPVGPGPASWSCDTTTPLALGTYEIRVRWSANDPSFTEASLVTTLTLHVVTALPPPSPAPTSIPTATPEPRPTETPRATPTAVTPSLSALLPVPTPASIIPAPAPVPVPVPELTPPEVAPVPVVPAPAPAAASTLPAPWDPTDHPREVLTLGIAAFALLSVVGPAGLAVSSSLGRDETNETTVAVLAGAGAVAAAGGSGKGGSVKSAKVKMTKFSGDGGGRGDRSRTWQLPGWQRLDAWSLAVPMWLATRSPLTARVLADGSYLRAIFSTAWGVLALAGGALGLAAAHQTDGVPIAPSVALTTALLVIAIFDATAGAAGVLGFLVGMCIWRSDQLSAASTIRSFLGLAALWFAIPLIAAATRPFRRTTVSGSRYAWDRLADTVIGTLTAGWAVQKTIGGMPGLSGLDLEIAHSADRIAVVAMLAIVVRVLVEELAAWRYPQRLSAVEAARLPFAGSRQRLFATALRTVLFVFLSIAFIGSCWQLWVGAVLFVVPQILSIYERKFPNSERLHGLLPGGILKVLLMMIIGSFFARLVFSILTNPESMLRNGFLLLTIPGLVLSVLGLFGHDGPDPRWTWPRQALGVVILGSILTLVFTGF